MKRRDLIKKLEAAGYKADRDGDHTIYEKKRQQAGASPEAPGNQRKYGKSNSESCGAQIKPRSFI